MSTLTISMPDSLREFVDQRVATSGYGNTSEYMRELVRRDREAFAKAQLEVELLKGLNSPPAWRGTADELPAYMAARKAEFLARHGVEKAPAAQPSKRIRKKQEASL